MNDENNKVGEAVGMVQRMNDLKNNVDHRYYQPTASLAPRDKMMPALKSALNYQGSLSVPRKRQK